MNLTLSIDDELLARARHIAEARGTSLNQMVRDYIAAVAGHDHRLEALNALEEMWSTERYLSDGTPFPRDDAYDDRVK